MLNFSGGLLAFINKKKFNIISTDFIKYNNTGPLNYFENIPDKFIRKGYQLIELKTKNNKKISIVNTHLFMNYRNNEKSNQMMKDQMHQVATVVKEQAKTNTYIICAGDFNIRSESDLIDTFIKETELEDLFCNEKRGTIVSSNINRKWYGKYKMFKMRCDYIFHSKNIKPFKFDIILDKPTLYDKTSIQASDHSGLECYINI